MKVLVHSQHASAYKAALSIRVLSSVMNRRAIREFQEALRYGGGHTLKSRQGQQSNKE